MLPLALINLRLWLKTIHLGHHNFYYFRDVNNLYKSQETLFIIGPGPKRNAYSARIPFDPKWYIAQALHFTPAFYGHLD